MDTKRIRIVQKNPNALFKRWLREVIEDAEKKKKKISKTYKKALDSLERYPLTLYSGHDCAILEGFGPKICDLLEGKLQKYYADLRDYDLKNLCYKDKIAFLREKEREELQDLVKNIEAANLINDSTMAEYSKRIELSRIEEQDDSDREAEIVIADNKENKNLSQEVDQNAGSKIQSDSEDSLDRLLKKYDPKAAEKRKAPKNKESPKKMTSFDSPVPTNRRLMKFKSFNAVGNSAGPSFASSPISKFLDVETSTPRRSILHDNDEDEFDRIVNKYNTDTNKRNEVLPSPIVPAKRKLTAKASNENLKAAPTRVIPVVQHTQSEDQEEDKLEYVSINDINPQDYEIYLLIDVGESKASSKDIHGKLQVSGKNSDVRKLHVGDFVWVARHKIDRSKELVLPYVVERKRLDDLSSSIKDGRFHEQKFRLKQCGIDNVIYLIENYSKGGKVQTGLPFNTLMQAAANTQIQNKFTVKFTDNSEHSGLYLQVLTGFMEHMFKNKNPVMKNLLEFNAFNQASVKQRKLTVRETFIKQLLALKGLSVDIALEITRNYPTPTDLYSTYLTLSKSEGEALLSKLTIGELKRKIPTTVSKVIYQFYMQK